MKRNGSHLLLIFRVDTLITLLMDLKQVMVTAILEQLINIVRLRCQVKVDGIVDVDLAVPGWKFAVGKGMEVGPLVCLTRLDVMPRIRPPLIVVLVMGIPLQIEVRSLHLLKHFLRVAVGVGLTVISPSLQSLFAFLLTAALWHLPAWIPLEVRRTHLSHWSES